MRFAMTNIREVIFFTGLSAVTMGLALVSISAALIVPGAILMWLALPPKSSGEKT